MWGEQAGEQSTGTGESSPVQVRINKGDGRDFMTADQQNWNENASLVRLREAAELNPRPPSSFGFVKSRLDQILGATIR
jgi:hypothetical protein